MSESADPHPSGRDPLPGRTTPTWEMELLISGATVFSLLQAPGLMDEVYYAIAPGLSSEYRTLATLPYLYLMTACLALIATFLAHLCVRGYWVALVGLGSVYPKGVDWERLRWGPGFVAALRRRTPALADTIERYDNRASQVFGFGVGLTFLSIGITLAVVIAASVAVAIHELSGDAVHADTILLALIGLIFGPYLLLYFADALMRNHPERHPRLQRWIEGALTRLLRVPFISGSNYPLLLFASHVGGRRGSTLMTIALIALIGVSALRMESGRDPWQPDGYALLPRDDKDGHTLDPRRYADQRERLGSLLPAVHIASERIGGDWLRVYIPFHPSPDSEALLRLCPALSESDPPAPDAVLACLPQRFRLTLDGQPPATVPDFVFARDPGSRLRGVVAMIDIRDLPRGRHELGLFHGDVREAREDGGEPASPPLRIPFWR
ncbi:MAG: hypothetical protein M9960_06945 [Xanthomonadaceae bacterium]|nr:hypothetical protein [Xanthomonadaceae bacterium]